MELLLLATQRCALACRVSVVAWSNHGFARSFYTHMNTQHRCTRQSDMCSFSLFLSLFHSFCTHQNISIKFRCDWPTTTTTASIAFSIEAQIDEFIFINYRLLRLMRLSEKCSQNTETIDHKSKPKQKQKQTPIVFGSTRGMFCRSLLKHRLSHMITSCDCLSNRAPA